MFIKSFLQFLIIFIIAFLIYSPAWAKTYYCGDDTYQTDCSGHGGYLCGDMVAVNDAHRCESHHGGFYTSHCGNQRIDAGEECDDGRNNSDTRKNACRTDCRLPHCGDAVADSKEECDGNDLNLAICTDYTIRGKQRNRGNNDRYKGGFLSCKPNCRMDFSHCEFCGDGIVQSEHEQCDDGNNINDDGCNTDCTPCRQLSDNIDIAADTELCTKTYNITDYGDEGVIIVKHPNITLDCDGANLKGRGAGTGIYIKMSNNVTIKNCHVSGYALGIKIVNSRNAKIHNLGNNFSANTQKIVLENSTAEAPVHERQAPAGRATSQGVMKPKVQGKDRQSTQTPGAIDRRTKTASIPAVPVITFPRRNQTFRAPATFMVKAKYDKRYQLSYGIKKPGQRQSVKKSTNGRFTNIQAGNYCVYVAYKLKGGAASECVPFKVVATKIPTKKTLPTKPTPVRPPSSIGR